MITIWSIATTIIFSSFFIGLFYLLKKLSVVSVIGLPTVTLLLLFIILRMTVLIEFPFSNVVVSTTILPHIDSFLRKSLCTFFTHKSVNFYFILTIVWLFIAAVKVFKLIRAHYFLHTSLRLFNKREVRPETLSRLSSECKLPKNIHILECDATTVPFVYGLLYPIIVFPKCEYTFKEEYFIIKHELEHFRKRDIWLKTLIEFLCALYWWNPFIYILRKQADSLLEMNVDRAVTKILVDSDKLEYLEFLLNTYKRSLKEKKYKNNVLLSGVAFGKNKLDLTQRFSLLLSHRKQNHSKLKSVVASIILCLFLITSYLFVFQPRYSLPNDNGIITLTSENAYLIQNTNGSYDVYLYNAGYLDTLEKPYPGLSILKMESEEDAK